MFHTPFMRPERKPREVFDWAVEQAIGADQAGFTEFWIGEHATMTWESIPNPELVISAAARETETIKFAPGAHLLPYYHPASLAIQVAWTSQILKGRYMLGVGAGAYPSDAALRGITDLSKNHAMMVEALEIMHRVWKAEPFHYEGEFWNAGYPDAEPGHPWRDTRPWNGKIDVGVTALSMKSSSVTYAGSHGFYPLSVYAGDAFLKQHWEDYSQAASDAGLGVDRSMHHVVRDAFVADTDAEAKRLAIEGGIGKAWKEYLLPTYKRFGILEGLKHDPSVDVETIDMDYLAEHVWLVGSVDTVVDKFNSWMESLGGFGTFMMYNHDYADTPEPWNESVRLMATEVGPRVKTPAAAVSA